MQCPNIFGINGQRKETFLGNESTFLGKGTTLSGTVSSFLGSNLKKKHFCGVGVESEFSRSSLGRRSVE